MGQAEKGAKLKTTRPNEKFVEFLEIRDVARVLTGWLAY